MRSFITQSKAGRHTILVGEDEELRDGLGSSVLDDEGALGLLALLHLVLNLGVRLVDVGLEVALTAKINGTQRLYRGLLRNKRYL